MISPEVIDRAVGEENLIWGKTGGSAQTQPLSSSAPEEFCML